MENLNLKTNEPLKNRQNVVCEVSNTKSGENKNLINLFLTKEQEKDIAFKDLNKKSKKEQKIKKITPLMLNRNININIKKKEKPELKLFSSISLNEPKKIETNSQNVGETIAEVDGKYKDEVIGTLTNVVNKLNIDAEEKKDLKQTIDNDFVEKTIMEEEGCGRIIDAFQQQENKLTKELLAYKFYHFSPVIKSLEGIEEKFKERPKNKNNAENLPLIAEDLKNLTEQVNGGCEKFKEIRKIYKEKEEELIEKNKIFVEFLNNLKKNSKNKKDSKELQELCFKVAKKVYELNGLYKDLYNYSRFEYILPTFKLITELQAKWDNILSTLTSK